MNGGRTWGLLIGGVVAIGLVIGGVVAYRNYKAAHGSSSSASSFPPPEIVHKPDKLPEGTVVEVPFIFWGGDVATFHANGGLETRDNSLFGKHGLKCKLTPGDDFDKQIEHYLANKSPFLRGTLSMLGQASEKLTAKPETMPIVFLQLTWSAGDHFVGRESFKDLNQLKGKKIALQKGGPHVGMLDDILRTVQLEWNDIEVVWTDEVSGPKGPADLFRKDKAIDACFAISPEMIELTSAPADGGVDSIGDGDKKSIKGAHVVVSTQHMSRSIADVYACRKDFYDDNRNWIDKFVAGYLKGCEDLVDVKKKALDEKNKTEKASYNKIIKLAQNIWGQDKAFKDQVAKEEDVDGLISDAAFVGLPGNESFFRTRGNLSGFDFKQKLALRLPEDPSKEPLKKDPKLFEACNFDYPTLRKLGDLHGQPPKQARIRAEAKVETDKQIFNFIITFKADQSDFPEAQYAADFQRALELASLFGNSAFVIGGHAAPTAVLIPNFLKAASEKGIIINQQDGTYTLPDGKKLNLKTDYAVLFDLIEKNLNLTTRDEAGQVTIRDRVAGLQKLSDDRAETVRKALESYARTRGLVVEQSQIRPKGFGARRPVVGYATNDADFQKNRRVEFLIIKVPAADVNPDEFDL